MEHRERREDSWRQEVRDRWSGRTPEPRLGSRTEHSDGPPLSGVAVAVIGLAVVLLLTLPALAPLLIVGAGIWYFVRRS